MSKYEYIDSPKNDPVETNPVWKMCLWLAVSTSGFYNWLSRHQSATAARPSRSVSGIFRRLRRTYG
ncbi:hypothetical protein GCM10027402_25460 [Arthrobacter monumenti]